MTKQTIYFQKAIPFTAGSQQSFTLPANNLIAVKIRHNVGTITGGTPGTYVANSTITNLVVNMNGVQMINFFSDIPANAEPLAILGVQKLSELIDKIASLDENYEIRFRGAIPANVQRQLVITWNTIANIQTSGGSGTTYSGTYDIIMEVDDAAPKVPVANQIAITPHEIVYGTSTGYPLNYLDVSMQNKRVLGLFCFAEDNGTGSNTAIESLTLTDLHGTQIFEENVVNMNYNTQKDTLVALGDGWFWYKFANPIVINPSALQLKAYISSAGTNVKLHYWMLMQ